MDRRAFLKRAGAIAASAGTGSAAISASSATASIGTPHDATLARPDLPGTRANALPGLRLAYLQGSARLLAAGSPPAERLGSLRWVSWDSRGTDSAEAPARREIGLCQLTRSSSAHPAIAALDVVTRFALDAPPHSAEFFAFSYASDRVGRNSAPVTFTVATPDRAALEFDYEVDTKQDATGLRSAGRIFLPVGGSGLGLGIYALLGPSARSGALPDPSEFICGGDLRAAMVRSDGAAPDFDHLVITVAGVAP